MSDARTPLLMPFPDVKPVNFVDQHVLDKLRRLNIHPADRCDDVTFLRRVSLDVIGSPPTPHGALTAPRPSCCERCTSEGAPASSCTRRTDRPWSRRYRRVSPRR